MINSIISRGGNYPILQSKLIIDLKDRYLWIKTCQKNWYPNIMRGKTKH